MPHSGPTEKWTSAETNVGRLYPKMRSKYAQLSEILLLFFTGQLELKTTGDSLVTVCKLWA